MGKLAGITIKPKTKPEVILPYLDKVDLVLVMSVEPGFGGQGLIPETLDNVRQLADIKKKNGYKFELEIDGGVKLDNLEEVKQAGAEVIVAGSAVFKGDTAANIKDFQSMLR